VLGCLIFALAFFVMSLTGLVFSTVARGGSELLLIAVQKILCLTGAWSLFISDTKATRLGWKGVQLMLPLGISLESALWGALAFFGFSSPSVHRFMGMADSALEMTFFVAMICFLWRIAKKLDGRRAWLGVLLWVSPVSLVGASGLAAAVLGISASGRHSHYPYIERWVFLVWEFQSMLFLSSAVFLVWLAAVIDADMDPRYR
jgi:hypothetical protein